MERMRWGDGAGPSPTLSVLIQNELPGGKGGDGEGRVDARRNGEEN